MQTPVLQNHSSVSHPVGLSGNPNMQTFGILGAFSHSSLMIFPEGELVFIKSLNDGCSCELNDELLGYCTIARFIPR